MLLMQIFFTAHLFACFWHLIAMNKYTNNDVYFTFDDLDPPERTWLSEFGYINASFSERYVASLYFIIVTMLTVGYGDIHATNRIERLYAIATMIVGAVVFGALISKVTMIIDKRNPAAKVSDCA
jgi:hypothetical protein